MINNLRSVGALGAVYVAVAAVGTAQAAGPDDRAEARGPGAIALTSAPGPDRFERDAAKSGGTTVIHGDDRSGLRGSGSIALTATSLPTVASTEVGLAWDDAALSVAATLAVVGVVGAGVVSLRRRPDVPLS
jgi:hypothetical protein